MDCVYFFTVSTGIALVFFSDAGVVHALEVFDAHRMAPGVRIRAPLALQEVLVGADILFVDLGVQAVQVLHALRAAGASLVNLLALAAERPGAVQPREAHPVGAQLPLLGEVLARVVPGKAVKGLVDVAPVLDLAGLVELLGESLADALAVELVSCAVGGAVLAVLLAKPLARVVALLANLFHHYLVQLAEAEGPGVRVQNVAIKVVVVRLAVGLVCADGPGLGVLSASVFVAVEVGGEANLFVTTIVGIINVTTIPGLLVRASIVDAPQEPAAGDVLVAVVALVAAGHDVALVDIDGRTPSVLKFCEFVFEELQVLGLGHGGLVLISSGHDGDSGEREESKCVSLHTFCNYLLKSKYMCYFLLLLMGLF